MRKLPLFNRRPATMRQTWGVGDQLAVRALRAGEISEFHTSDTGPGPRDEGVRIVHANGEVDMEVLAERYPAVMEIQSDANPIAIKNPHALYRLPLRVISITLQNPNDAEIFASESMSLDYLSMHGVSKIAAKRLRARWERDTEAGMILSLHTAKALVSPVSALDSWVYRDQTLIPEEVKKSVFSLFRRARERLTEGYDKDQVAIDLVQRINRPDGKHNFIETDEREELLAAIMELVNEPGEQWRETTGQRVDEIRRW